MSLVRVKNARPYNFTRNDYVYYNVNIFNEQDETIEAKFSENRSAPILDNPSNYELAIVRFSVPTINLPILILDNTKNYQISVRFNGSEFTKQVVWISNTNNPKLQNYIWNYQELVNSFNKALTECYNDIKAAQPTYPGTEAPYFEIDNNADNLVNFVGEQVINIDTSGVSYHINKELQALLPTISYTEDVSGGVSNPFYYTIILRDDKNQAEVRNGKNVYVMYSESSPLFLWNDFKTIVFTSNSIPIVPEILGSDRQITRRVITDFEPESGFDDRTPIQFFPQGPLRWYSLKSTQPLTEIDISVSWQDKAGRLFPIGLAKFDNVSVKILFRNKSVRNPLEDYEEDL